MSVVSCRWSVPVLGLLVFGIAACGERVQTVEGSCDEVFDGEVCTWGTLTGDDVTAFGATVPLAAIESAPLDAELVFPPAPIAVIPLPNEVKQATGFDHLGVNWEAHGHPPALFAVPHFDFHFYTVDPTTVDAIDCSDLAKPAQLPEGYALPDITIPGIGELVGLCVPDMGMHAMRADELEQTEPFSAANLVGYYGTDVVFLEPMISRATLLAGETFTADVPSVSAGASVHWPSHFEAVFDTATRSYRFTFSGMTDD